MAVLDHLDFNPVIGWAFVTETVGQTTEVFAEPLVWKWNQDPSLKLLTLATGRTAVAVVQVPERTQEVRAFYDDGSDKVIGYQVLGASHPQDWEQLGRDEAPPP